MPGVFVTGTGTDVGKTYTTANFTRHLLQRGSAAAAIKPVISGFAAAAPETSDTGLLLAAMGMAVDTAGLVRVSPWRFAAPMSPDMAALREGRPLDYSAILEFCRRRLGEARETKLLIEGVGGIMVPLDAYHTVLDLMQDLALPVLLVAGSYLGTISHTLSAVAMLRVTSIAPAAVVISESPESQAPLAEIVETIARFANPVPVIAVPRDAAADHRAFAEIAERLGW